MVFHYTETNPVETDSSGTPLAHQMWLLSHASSTQEFNGRRYFSLNLQGNSLLLNLTKNQQFLPGQEILLLRVGQDNATTTHVINSSGNDCRYTGSVHRSGEEPPVGWAAVSTCKGMVSPCHIIRLFICGVFSGCVCVCVCTRVVRLHLSNLVNLCNKL